MCVVSKVNVLVKAVASHLNDLPFQTPLEKNLGRDSNSSLKLLKRKLILPRSHNSLTGFDCEL